MKTTIIGFPRIGENRELKKTTEQYFKGEISQQQLLKTGTALRSKHWTLLKKMGIEYIPCSDFSFYDTTLDTANMLNIIPDRFQSTALNKLDRYFAMAKGIQTEEYDLHALEMKKWFNTNYHYIVPEFDGISSIQPDCEQLLAQYNEAKKLGITTTPVIVGPFSLIKLSKCKTDSEKFKTELIVAYQQILTELKRQKVESLQIDEPWLVRDLSTQDKHLFLSIYKELLPYKNSLKIFLQTYFGDIRDIYSDLITLDFDGIGLDFIEGEKNLELIEKNGFPKKTLLFAGAINGKNIWRNEYKKTVALMQALAMYIPKENIILNTACSLLHVPYTTRNETKLPADTKMHLAFAEEKLKELQELSEILASDKPTEHPTFKKNIQLHISRQEHAECHIKKIREKTAKIANQKIARQPEFSKRSVSQQSILNLPTLPTTTIGSFPQTSEIRHLRRQYRSQAITTQEYETAIKKKITQTIALQEEIGLDVLVHGEFERNDMVEYFGENLEGFIFTQNGWVQSYGTRGVKPPIIFGDIWRKQPITVKWISYAQSLTKKPVKAMLTGPTTILNWSFPREDIPSSEIAFQLAAAIKEEVLDLEAAGIKIIQIDEAAIREKLPLRKDDWNKKYLDWAIKAFRVVHAQVQPKTQIHTHMCYSDFKDIIHAISDMDADVVTIESARSDLSMLDSLEAAKYDKEVGPGVYDIHSPRVPSVEEFSQTIQKMCSKLEKKRLWVNPDCGLKTRGEKETIASLKNMVIATKALR